MKKLYTLIILCVLILSLSACSGMAISSEMYNEISDYVTQNIDDFSPEKETEFYDYKATGLSTGGVNYGYYYSDKNDLSTSYLNLKRNEETNLSLKHRILFMT